VLPQDTLFRIVRRQLIQALGETGLKICIFDPKEDLLTISYDSSRAEPARATTEPLGDDLSSVVIRSRQPLLLTDNPAQRAAMLGVSDFSEGVKSWLGVPMLLGDDILGRCWRLSPVKSQQVFRMPICLTKSSEQRVANV